MPARNVLVLTELLPRGPGVRAPDEQQAMEQDTWMT